MFSNDTVEPQINVDTGVRGSVNCIMLVRISRKWVFCDPSYMHADVNKTIDGANCVFVTIMKELY